MASIPTARARAWSLRTCYVCSSRCCGSEELPSATLIRNLSVWLVLRDLVVGGFDLLLQQHVTDPWRHGHGQLDGSLQLLSFFPSPRAILHGLEQLGHELLLPAEQLPAAGQAMTRQHIFHLQLL